MWTVTVLVRTVSAGTDTETGGPVGHQAGPGVGGAAADLSAPFPATATMTNAAPARTRRPTAATRAGRRRQRGNGADSAAAGCGPTAGGSTWSVISRGRPELGSA